MRASLLLVVFGMLLAGCTAAVEEPVGETTSRPALEAHEGGIVGLLVDDVYRPVAEALVLLQGTQFTATTDDLGRFEFTKLVPGAFVLVAAAPGHEAAPQNLDVLAGEYAEVELVARRLFSDDGYIVTTEYSIFTACATSFVQSTLLYSCLADDDSYRPGLNMANFTYDDITYLVAEVRVNQPDNYAWVLRCSGGGSYGCGEYAYVNVTTADPKSAGVYAKAVLKLGENHMNTWQSKAWHNNETMDMLLFYMGQGGESISAVTKPAGCTATETWDGLPDPVPAFPENPLNDKPLVCRDMYGAGHRFAVQGRIIMSLFLGEPKTPIAEYQVLGP